MIKPLIPIKQEGLDDIAKGLLETTRYNIPTPTVRARVNKSDYIVVPNTNIIISKEEIHRGLDWNNTHYALADNGLYMPSPSLFVNYFKSVLEAKKGNLVLSYADNTTLSIGEVDDLYKYLTTNHRNGCWTWLGAKFDAGSGHKSLDIETDYKVVKIGSDKKLEGKRSPLEVCVSDNGFVDLNFNRQGLPTGKTKSQKYSQGNNIYFYSPVNDRVARFESDSGWADLSCGGDPAGSDAGLGVFACADFEA